MTRDEISGSAPDPRDGAWKGGWFGSHTECIVARNAGPMTLDGTNTWVVRAEDFGRSVVIDPGPLDEQHLHAVADAAGAVEVVLLTHGETYDA